ncbi:MAG TPA: S1 RNA-binding domain-containing protein [Anaerolineales bacterium]|nr:S1 RNA-binding domain-containing protein [Anaerolineales bacterium]
MTLKNSSVKRKYENSMLTTDEGWWESVLAEERLHAPTRPPQTAVVKPRPTVEEKVESVSPVVPARANWDEILELYSADRIISMKVTGHNRGGLLVETDSLAGFVPFSHLIELAGRDDEDRDISLESYVGKSLNLKVIECVPEDGRVVFSERAALAEPGRRSKLFNSLENGAHVKGTVTNITDFGVFVDLGGVEGLIHISELSWGRVSHPSRIVSLGQEIEVQVLDVSVERCRVALSLKRLISNPWDRALTEFPVNTVLPAVVTSVLSYGAFARIDAGVEGLIHASEMPLDASQSPRDSLKEGQQIQIRILHLDIAHQRMGLSMHLDH